MRFMVSPGQTIFARWKNSYYYPAVVDEVLDNQIKVTYLDGDKGTVAREHILELQEAFETLNFQGNWKHGGIFFKGALASHQPPLVMHYNDGDVEQVELVQLRGAMPKSNQKVAGAAPESEARSSSRRDPKAGLEQLKSMRKAGLIDKAEFKRRKELL
ncbi:MAG: hypothetical protein FWC72_01665 [Oscillospiraceae bacterium]|nr:hypothetical protein [Oscillospiraceae bacterium]